MKELYFSDHTEKRIAAILNRLHIEFVHESQDKNQKLDFYLPDYDIFIEVKRFYSKRIAGQISGHENVIVIQGVASVAFLEIILEKYQKST